MLHSIQLVMNPAGHEGTGTVVQEDNASTRFMQTFALDLGTQI
jgi:hypothetical protein